eukprot:scaffold9085_cov215-Amphora_coffeaeformis.AAC.3
METINGNESSIQEQPDASFDVGHYSGRPLFRPLTSMRRKCRIAVGKVAVLMIIVIVMASKWSKDVGSGVIHKNYTLAELVDANTDNNYGAELEQLCCGESGTCTVFFDVRATLCTCGGCTVGVQNSGKHKGPVKYDKAMVMVMALAS